VYIAPGQTIGRKIDIAEIYDTPTGNYDIAAAGTFPYAEANSTALTGHALSFTSNKINVDIDGDVAAKVDFRIYRSVSSRTDLSSDCTGDQLSAVSAALSNCEKLASAASNTAANGDGTIFSTYFKTESARPDVAARLKAVAEDCASQNSGATTTSCSDTYQGCSSQVLAYTVVQRDAVVLCPAFFELLPPLANGCHAQDQATTIIHENTHAPAVYSPGTSDNGYGYAAATSLSSSQALANADSYALYANAIYLDCEGSGYQSGSGSNAVSSSPQPSTESSGESSGEVSNGGSDSSGGSTGGSSSGFTWPGWAWLFRGDHRSHE
jgi:deuterolysin